MPSAVAGGAPPGSKAGMKLARAGIPEGWPAQFKPLPGVVDVVSCPLDLSPRAPEELVALLSAEERYRAVHLRTAEARRAFVAARGRLRQLLGLLVNCAPHRVSIGVNARGKPRLCDDANPRLRFSVAHSADLLLCAVTLDDEIGVDVERVDSDLDWERIARRFLAAEEATALRLLPPDAQRSAFFGCWTRKEAVVKATGEGLARALDSFVVSVDPAHAEVSAADASLGPASDWSLFPIPLPPAYQGTVAIKRRRVALRLSVWSDA
jgi:4'-phosphopantetheinyl transferase